MGRYRIISFDGGGVRSVLTAVILKRLSTYFPDLIKKTHLFVGSSSGSLIALGLAYGLTPEYLVDLFSEQNARFILNPRHIEYVRSKYDNTNLIKFLSKIFPEELTMRDLQFKVIVLSFKLAGQNRVNWGPPVFFSNLPGSDTIDTKVIDVALYGSAVPIYFPAYKEHIDGGVVANNPSTAAIAAVVDKKAGGQELKDICLLSIGTGLIPNNITADTAKWGVVEWLLYPDPLFPLTSLMQEGRSEIDTIFGSQLLGEKYFRINPILSEPIYRDEHEKMPKLISFAEKIVLGSAVEWIQENWYL